MEILNRRRTEPDKKEGKNPGRSSSLRTRLGQVKLALKLHWRSGSKYQYLAPCGSLAPTVCGRRTFYPLSRYTGPEGLVDVTSL